MTNETSEAENMSIYLLPSEDLIHYILTNYHEKHRSELPELIKLAAQVESAHSEHVHVPKGLVNHLSTMFEELSDHMNKEEQILFPMMQGGMVPPGPIFVMEQDHLAHEQALAQLKSIAKDFKAPADACGTWLALYSGLETLYNDLLAHIDLENNHLFPRFR